MPEFQPYEPGDLVHIYWRRERKNKVWTGIVEEDGSIRILSKREAREKRREIREQREKLIEEFPEVGAALTVRENQVESEQMPPQDRANSEQGVPESKGAEWKMLLTIPVGWRPAAKTFYADGLMGEPPRNQHSVDTDGLVRIHPDARSSEVKWALHHNLNVPREALGLPGEDPAWRYHPGSDDPTRHSQEYDPPSGPRISGQRYDKDDIPPREDLE